MYAKMENPIFYSDRIFYAILLIRPLCPLYHMGIRLLSYNSISFITLPSFFAFCSKKETRAEKISSSVLCLFTFIIIFSSSYYGLALFPNQRFIRLQRICVPRRHDRETNREPRQIPRYKLCGLALLCGVRNDFPEALPAVIHKGPEKVQLIAFHYNVRP